MVSVAKKAEPKQAKAVLSAKDDRPISYPEIEVWRCWAGATGEEAGPPISIEKAKALLKWETEKEYLERIGDEKGKSKDFEPTLRDEEGNKVCCWNSDRNRPFDEGWCRSLAQDVLSRNWAGPTTVEGATVNGETIIIGRTGRIQSGNHRLIALVLAGQIREKQPKWQELWADPPVLESLVVMGVSEHSKIVRTLDNTKPRTLSDVFFTSDIFLKLGTAEKKECSRMLDRAVDLLWKRTQAGTPKSGGKVYQTHSESLTFLERHKTLLKCVAHIFEENRERGISTLRLSPGESAALCYLMILSKSDPEAYHSADVRSEKKLDQGMYERACFFWTEMAKGDKGSLRKVKEALGRLVDPDTGTDGRAVEKRAILAKAWLLFAEEEKIDVKDLALSYTQDEHGKDHLSEYPTVGGIDLGDGQEPEEAEEQEDPKEAKERARKEAAETATKKIQALRESKGKEEKPEPKSFKEEIEALKTEHEGKLILHKGPNSWYAWGEDAQTLGKLLRAKVNISMTLPRAEFPLKDLDPMLVKLKAAGYKVHVIEAEANHKPTKKVTLKPKAT